jgi:hypothetical protein
LWLFRVSQENDNGASAISALQWASANSLSVTGHVLLWGEFSGDYMPQDTWTMTAAQLRPRILNHVSGTTSLPSAHYFCISLNITCVSCVRVVSFGKIRHRDAHQGLRVGVGRRERAARE